MLDTGVHVEGEGDGERDAQQRPEPRQDAHDNAEHEADEQRAHLRQPDKAAQLPQKRAEFGHQGLIPRSSPSGSTMFTP